MLGEKADYEVVPYFFSDLADWASLEYVGHAQEWDEVVFRGDPGDGEFSAWYVNDNRLDAALAVGRGEDLQHARRLIEAGETVADSSVLADVDADLSELASR
jgi:3-phenylpropionate/trans-cinnamate dioxygenase ferredoxin reductase component